MNLASDMASKYFNGPKLMKLMITGQNSFFVQTGKKDHKDENENCHLFCK